MEDLDISELLYHSAVDHNVTLPSGAVASIREMNGHDQRKFMNKTSLNNGSAINDLLANCTQSINEEPIPDDPKARTNYVMDLLEGDRQALLFAIRRYSLGDDFTFTMDCPHCKKRDTWEVTLSDIAFTVHEYPLGREKILYYTSKVIPNLEVKVKLLDGHASIAALRKGDTSDLLTDLEFRVPQYKNPKGEWVGIKLNSVSDRVIGELRKELRQAEGRIDSRVTIFCKNCGEPALFDLLQVPDFMIPNVIY